MSPTLFHPVHVGPPPSAARIVALPVVELVARLRAKGIRLAAWGPAGLRAEPPLPPEDWAGLQAREAEVRAYLRSETDEWAWPEAEWAATHCPHCRRPLGPPRVWGLCGECARWFAANTGRSSPP
jgi:hypothetical protein